MNKKHTQLGMNPSTASGRLIKDLLWSLIVKTGQDHCCKCGEQMRRDTFSVEHVLPWLDSADPVKLFFDLDNIRYSHLRCNVSGARKQRAVCGQHRAYSAGCRCEVCRAAKRDYMATQYTPEKRRERYTRTGR